MVGIQSLFSLLEFLNTEILRRLFLSERYTGISELAILLSLKYQVSPEISGDPVSSQLNVHCSRVLRCSRVLKLLIALGEKSVLCT